MIEPYKPTLVRDMLRIAAVAAAIAIIGSVCLYCQTANYLATIHSKEEAGKP